MGLPVMTIEGDVTAAHSYWTEDRSAIVTEATVHTSDGDVVVNQLGGTVDGIGMRQFPGAPVLEPGMKVSVAAHPGLDAQQRRHVVLDSVQIRDAGLGAHYVRTGPTKAGNALYWETRNIQVTIDSAGTAAIPYADLVPVINASLETWNTDTASCSSLKTTVVGSQALEVGNDKVNLIKFRDTHWGRPAVGSAPARDYSPVAAAITTVVFIDDDSSSRDGAIVDADIELNNVNFHITIEPDENDSANAVLQNTLTHEVGHLRGLEHPCRASSDEPERVDNKGNPVPLCTAALPPEITEATMYNYQSPGETKKETLSPDDIQAMCDIYGSSGGCCSASNGRPDVSMLLAGVTFGLLIVGRRKKLSTTA